MPSEITNALVAQGLTPKESFISTGGTPAQNALKQFDGSFGGPIRRDKIWFFGSMRYSNVEVPIARTSKNVSDIKGFYPDAKLFNNLIEGYQPYVKVTGRMGAHELEGVFQRDRTNGESSWEYFAEPLNVYGNGGNLYMGKITSVWGQRLTTSFMAGYNDKGGSSQATYKWSRFQGSGPEVDLYSGAARQRRPYPRRQPDRAEREPLQRVGPARLADHAARRRHLLQGGVEGLARVPDAGSSSSPGTPTT